MVLLLFPAFDVFASTMGPWPQITRDDRVLILAPHPDDETIGAGGVIQEAAQVGAPVKIVLLTNGENNELSFIVYKKRPILSRRGLIAMGQIRRAESISAAAVLGIDEKDIITLGYPDFGTMDIMNRFWGDTKPFRSMLSRVRQVPYSNAMSPGAPYVGESILRDLKAVILSYKPTKIVVSHPADVNRDHRALYLFLKIALWDLEGKISKPDIYPYLIHVVGWPKPRGFHPDHTLGIPKDLDNSNIAWTYLKLDPDNVERKYEAIQRYVSQIKYAPHYLVTFARQNELFGDYQPIKIVKQMSSDVKWQYVGTSSDQLSNSKDHISLLGYARQGDYLLIRVSLRQEIEKDLGLTIYLMGYSRDIPFSKMPKITLNVGVGGLIIRDKSRRIPSKDVNYTSEGKVLTFRLPLSFLGNPQRILTTAKASVYNLTLDETAWRELNIIKGN